MSAPEAGPLDIAIIGTGIAGMACAWLLAERHNVTVYEASDRIGGHANTVEVAGDDAGPLPIDTGFIVYNEPSYPNLTALFDHLGVETAESEMSFAVSLDGGRLEYAGTNLRGLFAQKRNLLRPRFWSMLRDLLRFYREAPAQAGKLATELTSLGDYLAANGYGEALRQDHLLPMAAAIWSCSTTAIQDYPAAAFIRFCENHGLLRVTGRPVWRTVRGGSRRYVESLTANHADRILLNRGVVSVARRADCVLVRDRSGLSRRFDHAVVATHAHQALAMLETPSASERALLGAFATSRNMAVLHTDTSLMPRRRQAWSSWNYIGERTGTGAPCVTYWMNRLQGIPGTRQYFVTLNPIHPPAPGTLLRTESYNHPQFDSAAIRAQPLLWSLQGVQRTWFCGAWFGAGFHEDGLQAGLAVAEQLGRARRPWRVADESGRIHVSPVPVADPLPDCVS